MHKTWVEINKKALKNNIAQFKKLIEKTSLMAVVKSNAYGHGLVETAKILKGAGPAFGEVNFGVDSIDEAIRLKKAGINSPILILGYTLNSRLKDVIKYGFRQVVYNKETVAILGKLNKKVKIHLKIETGTFRQGTEKNEILDFIKLIKRFPKIEIEGIYTHFANIEDTTNHDYADRQLNRFKEVIDLLGKNNINIQLKHTACTAATILFPETYFNLVRTGIGIYGLWPSKETFVSAKNEHKNLMLEPVLSWKTKIAQIKNIKSGTEIGYGLTEKVFKNSKIAIIPIGYFDGYDRKLSGIGNVLIRGRRCKVLGRICMNMTIVDVSHVSGAKVEDEVILIGRQAKEQITAEELAQKVGSINYEIVTRINPLIPRIIV
jgi:alanine racemase